MKFDAEDNSLVVRYDVPEHYINSITLAKSILHLADLIKDANNLINPGWSVEVVVEAFEQGSFRTKLLAIKNSVGNLFSSEPFRTIVLGVIANYIYQMTIAPNTDVKMQINTNEVIIETPKGQLIVPRVIHDATEELKKSTAAKEKLSDTFQTIDKDTNVTGITFEKITSEGGYEELMHIPKESFQYAIDPSATRDEKNERIIFEIAEVQILKAILAKSKRKWEFVWRGEKLSAPVTDVDFYRDFANHKITIAPGDYLKIRIKITQKKDEFAGIYLNTGYEIVQVYEHKPKPTQLKL
jgi:hypothetical protein